MGCQSSTQSTIPNISIGFQNLNKEILPELIQKKCNYKMKKQKKQFSGDDILMIDHILSQHSILYKLNYYQRKQLIDNLQCYSATSNITLFNQGDIHEHFIIIKEGQIHIINQQKQIFIKIYEKDTIQDQSLIYNNRLAVKAVTMRECKLWVLNSDIFKQYLVKIQEKHYFYIRKQVFEIDAFQCLNGSEKESILKHIHTLSFKKNQTIFSKGQFAHALYFIMKGQVEIRVPKKQLLVLRRGELFGESALTDSKFRSGSAVCSEPTVLFSISRQNLMQSLGSNFQKIVHFITTKWSLMRCCIFKNLRSNMLNMVINEGLTKHYKQNQIICQKGSKIQRLVVCIEGSINGSEIGSIFNLSEGFCVLSKMSRDLIQTEEGFTFEVEFSKLKLLFGKAMRSLRKQLLRQQNIDLYYIVDFNNIKLCNFYIHKKVQQSDEKCHVYEVIEHEESQSVYTIKCIKKNRIDKQLENILFSQKQNWSLIQCPFVSRLYRIFIDSNYIYYLYKYYEGGRLSEFLLKNKFIDLGQQNCSFFNHICPSSIYERQSSFKFSIACIIQAIQYLHQQDIIHRNISAQTISIDSQGYLSISDLSLSIRLKSKNGRTSTIIGIPGYMAPQMISGRGYGKSVDIWALGVITYKMYCGFFPFGIANSQPMQVYNLILKKELLFPSFYKDQLGRQFIAKLLNKNQQQRTNIIPLLKESSFFDKFDWKLLKDRAMKSPHEIITHSYGSMTDFQMKLVDVLQAHRQ